jgi:hypothetical protein
MIPGACMKLVAKGELSYHHRNQMLILCSIKRFSSCYMDQIYCSVFRIPSCKMKSAGLEGK